VPKCPSDYGAFIIRDFDIKTCHGMLEIVYFFGCVSGQNPYFFLGLVVRDFPLIGCITTYCSILKLLCIFSRAEHLYILGMDATLFSKILWFSINFACFVLSVQNVGGHNTFY
jgi:hypothetical protein